MGFVTGKICLEKNMIRISTSTVYIETRLVCLTTTAVMQYALEGRSPLYWVCLVLASAWNSGKVLKSQNNCLCFSSCCVWGRPNRCVLLLFKTTLHSLFSEGWSGNHFSTSMLHSGLIRPPNPPERVPAKRFFKSPLTDVMPGMWTGRRWALGGAGRLQRGE